jgi:hypothetical protein
MSTKGTIIYDGTLKCDIYDITLSNGEFRIKSKATLPRKKDIPHGHGDIPFVIYGEDESIMAVGVTHVRIFNEPRKQISFGDMYVEHGVKLITSLETP